MDITRFRTSLEQSAPPDALSFALQGLWWDGKGDWAKAHELAQEQEDDAGNWVHAYLHRKEGDLPNAGYWYRRANQTMPQVTLEREWEEIVTHLLSEQRP